jgi:Fe-S-cluster containining protein
MDARDADEEERLSEYDALLAKVDAWAKATASRRADAFECRAGCEACCHVALTVCGVEAAALRRGLRALGPEARARIGRRGAARMAQEEARDPGHAPVEGAHAVAAAGDAGDGQPATNADPAVEGVGLAVRCVMLEDDGTCAVYDARPLVCRTQGHALRYPAGVVPEEAVRARGRRAAPNVRHAPDATAGPDAITWCPLNYTGAPPRAEDVLDAARVDALLALIDHRYGAASERVTLVALAAEAALW